MMILKRSGWASLNGSRITKSEFIYFYPFIWVKAHQLVIITAFTTNTTPIVFLHAHSPFMHFCILRTASKQMGQFGAIGHSQWNNIVVPYSQQFEAANFLMPHLIGMQLKQLS